MFKWDLCMFSQRDTLVYLGYLFVFCCYTPSQINGVKQSSAMTMKVHIEENKFLPFINQHFGL